MDDKVVFDIESDAPRGEHPFHREQRIEVVYICSEPEDRMSSGLRSEMFFDREPYYNGHPRSLRETRRSQKRGHKR